MKHKHAEVIKAFVDGVECEVWFESSERWKKVDCVSDFDVFDTVRIKPKPKRDLVDYAYVHDNFEHYNGVTRMVWSSEKSGNLKLIWDGETGKLKDAEVVK